MLLEKSEAFKAIQERLPVEFRTTPDSSWQLFIPSRPSVWGIFSTENVQFKVSTKPYAESYLEYLKRMNRSFMTKKSDQELLEFEGFFANGYLKGKGN